LKHAIAYRISPRCYVCAGPFNFGSGRGMGSTRRTAAGFKGWKGTGLSGWPSEGLIDLFNTEVHLSVAECLVGGAQLLHHPSTAKHLSISLAPREPVSFPSFRGSVRDGGEVPWLTSVKSTTAQFRPKGLERGLSRRLLDFKDLESTSGPKGPKKLSSLGPPGALPRLYDSASFCGSCFGFAVVASRTVH
jgi:hypothetical protein